MAKWLVLICILSACNLSSGSAVPTTTVESSATAAEVILSPANQPLDPTPAQLGLPSVTNLPTRLPQVGAVLPTSAAVQATPNGVLRGQSCTVYLVYSGSDPANVISLRAQPSSNSPQVMRIPNNARVLLIPGTQEVTAEGYHWLNIIYVDGLQNRYEGWAARDSFMQAGIRDPSVQTLRAMGEQINC